MASPDINTEDFSAAVDYLSNRSDVNPEQIGIIGICGWGGFAINAAANDPRIKATVASTMYDISRGTANGYFDASDNADSRNKMRRDLAAQRTEDYKQKEYARTEMNPKPVEEAPQFIKDYYDYYKTKRGFHPRSTFRESDGTRLPLSVFLMHLSSHTVMRSKVPCCLFMEKKPIHFISARGHSRN